MGVMDGEQMGIIRDPGYGMRDFPSRKPGLWFTVYTDDSSASLQCFFGEEADRIFAEGGVHDVKDLNGRACYVRQDGGYVRFIRLAKFG
jgi:hypothetical protein